MVPGQTSRPPERGALRELARCGNDADAYRVKRAATRNLATTEKLIALSEQA